MTNPVGRPSSYTPERAEAICALLAEGMSLRTVCKQEGMPDCATVFSWMRKFPEFLKQYEKSKAESADYLVEEMLDIADDGSNDWMEKHSKEGENIGWQVNGEHVQRSRLRLDTRKWIASKLKAKKYGEKIEIAGDPDAPLTVLQSNDQEIINRYLTSKSLGDNNGTPKS